MIYTKKFYGFKIQIAIDIRLLVRKKDEVGYLVSHQDIYADKTIIE